jgi:hypothetical protein
MPPKKSLQCFTKERKDGSNYTTCIEGQDKKKKKKMKLRVVKKKVEEPKPKARAKPTFEEFYLDLVNKGFDEDYMSETFDEKSVEKAKKEARKDARKLYKEKFGKPKPKVEEPKPKKKKKLNIKKKVPKGKVLDNDETTLPYGDIPYAPLFNRKANGVYPSVYDLEPPKEREKWSYQEMPNPNKGGFREKDRYDDWKEDSDYLRTYTSRADYIRQDWERLGSTRTMQSLRRGGYDEYGRFSHAADDDQFWRYHAANPGAFD